MLFNSLQFPVFFALFFIVFALIPSQYRKIWLLVASCYFYMVAIPQYVLILFALIAIDFVAAIWIERAEGQRRHIYLVCSIVANLSALVVFKYFNFFVGNVEAILASVGLTPSLPHWQWALPIGLSFHTFQSLSYTIEVYYRRQTAERSLLNYALYVMFWPQLVAGPIERPQNLLPQLRGTLRVGWGRLSEAVPLLVFGYAKKMLVADRLSHIANPIFADPSVHSTSTLWLGVYAFALQIFCDFSGYTDIARGCAKLMGIDLMENFNRPYLALSITDFWRRWHISLSTWFRDYVYLPLGGSRVGSGRVVFNLVLVFLVSGLWHGASWNFVLWGAWHGMCLVVERHFGWGTSTAKSQMVGLMRWALTFHLVCLGWVLFRAPDMSVAITYFQGLCGLIDGTISVAWIRLVTAMILIATMFSSELCVQWFQAKPKWVKVSVYYGCILAVMALGVLKEEEFIYFQF